MKRLSKILVLLVAVLMVISLTACGDDVKNNGNDTTVADTTAKDTTAEDTTAEDTTAEDTTAEDTTAEDTTAEDTTAEDTTAEDTTAEATTAVDTTAVDTTAEDTTAEDTTAEDTTAEDTTAEDTTANNNILGQGSQDQPYLEIPAIGDDSMTVTTVSVPAGKALFYNIYRVGGMVATVNSSDVYVVCGGVRYDTCDGVVTFTVPAALASDAVSFEIGNTGSADASFTLEFTNAVGTQANPHKLDSVSKTATVNLAEGDSDGYTYVYRAEKAGTVRFYMSADCDCVLSVTNNRSYAQRTTDADGQTDDEGTYVELQVEKSDELVILVASVPDRRGNYPAASITWFGKYI